ncbi:G-type lectin S-receptor-like serine/threonine-protein kinase SD1-13 [Cornus florida]|uniref:G-type lectin S-receptor-like serine/threonine-protein kinase SD1-13 n=1 Tax=Cornus florida TaxID=4283 RepID=UPI00289CD1FC|nr:G-type lectin S-receptor-like serine/threonine-protein kinase SD1-13 [Cornus florida]
MSPEYAMEGLFSEKSDVFSFAVLLLEIISSKRNTGFYHHKTHPNLLGYAWQLWNEGKTMELLDSRTADSISSPSQVMRCIHVGLLCAQEQPNDRPSMATIVFILCNDTTLPTLKQPAFILERSTSESNLPLPNSNNYIFITNVEGR